MSHWPSRFSSYANRIIPSAIRGLASIPRAADTISFGAGEPDANLFPVARIQSVLAQIMADTTLAKRALQYGSSEGEMALRERVCAYMQSKGVPCRVQNVLITNGAQQALDLVAELLIEKGSKVVVQSPTYPGALQIFAAHGASLCHLENARAEAGRKPALIYAMTTFQNPSGKSLSIEERRQLLDLAEELDTIVVEDDPYELLRYEGEPLPPLLALDSQRQPIDSCRSVYLGSFSKSIVPGFRTGWLVAAQPAVEKLTLMKQTEDLQAGTLAQTALSQLFDFVIKEHAPNLSNVYRQRRDAMLSALAKEFGDQASWSKPAGGFFVWLTLPEHVDARALLVEAARTGVVYVPGSAFFYDERGKNTLRLSYSSATPERIPQGVARLAEVVRKVSKG